MVETTDRRDFGGKRLKWKWRRVLSWKIPEFCSVGGARSKTAFFSRFRIPSTVLCTAYRKQFYLKPMVPWKAETLMVCLLLVWIVCDQAFGRYRPWMVRKVVTWPSRKMKICIQTHVKKFSDSKNAILFDLRRKITKLSRKNRFGTVASPGACGAKCHQ